MPSKINFYFSSRDWPYEKTNFNQIWGTGAFGGRPNPLILGMSPNTFTLQSSNPFYAYLYDETPPNPKANINYTDKGLVTNMNNFYRENGIYSDSREPLDYLKYFYSLVKCNKNVGDVLCTFFTEPTGAKSTEYNGGVAPVNSLDGVPSGTITYSGGVRYINRTNIYANEMVSSTVIGVNKFTKTTGDGYSFIRYNYYDYKLEQYLSGSYTTGWTSLIRTYHVDDSVNEFYDVTSNNGTYNDMAQENINAPNNACGYNQFDGTYPLFNTPRYYANSLLNSSLIFSLWEYVPPIIITGKNIGGFDYPQDNPDIAVQFNRWSAPSLKQRLPFQNYGFSLPFIKGK